jgi:hypothetical protein
MFCGLDWLSSVPGSLPGYRKRFKMAIRLSCIAQDVRSRFTIDIELKVSNVFLITDIRMKSIYNSLHKLWACESVLT